MPTALIVDDNATLAYFTARNLEKGVRGLEVFTAKSCEEARDEAARHMPCVLISDITLTDGNGIDLVNELMDRYPDMLAVLISGEPPGKAVRRDLFGFLLKPYEAGELVALVNNALERSGPTEREPESRERHERQEYQCCNGYDRHKLRNRLGELVAGLRSFGKELQDCSTDPEAIRRTVDEYLDQLCTAAIEVARELPGCPVKRSDRPPTDRELSGMHKEQ
ncbi:MAG: response regulator [Pseudomonadota bacterium]